MRPVAQAAPPVLAIAQIPMPWELADNVKAMTQALQTARNEGATICAFSELAVTGFHRRIAEWARPERAVPAVDEVRAQAARLGIAAVFGAPTFTDQGTRFNSHLFVDAGGALVGCISKAGLTAPEATFFAPGTGRPVLHLAGLACSAVICREIEDAAVVVPQLQGTWRKPRPWPASSRPMSCGRTGLTP